MNHAETVILARKVRATCPQQAIDKYTPDAWHPLLSDLLLADCEEALTNLGRRQPFIAPAELRAEVRRIRDARIKHAVIPAPPTELADDPRAFIAAAAELERRAGDGEFPAAAPGTLAITGAPPELAKRQAGPPQRLGAALGDLRRRLGQSAPGRRHRSPQQAAAEQVAEARGES